MSELVTTWGFSYLPDVLNHWSVFSNIQYVVCGIGLNLRGRPDYLMSSLPVICSRMSIWLNSGQRNMRRGLLASGKVYLSKLVQGNSFEPLTWTKGGRSDCPGSHSTNTRELDLGWSLHNLEQNKGKENIQWYMIERLNQWFGCLIYLWTSF